MEASFMTDSTDRIARNKGWIREDGVQREYTELRAELEHHRQIEWQALGLYGHHKNVMLALITACLAGCFGILALSASPVWLLLPFAPVAVRHDLLLRAKNFGPILSAFSRGGCEHQ